MLGLDQASKRTGWAVLACGKYVQSGEVDTFDLDAVRKVIDAALTLAELDDLPCCLVYEGHSMRVFGSHSFAVPAHLVAAKKIWQHEWQRLAKLSGHAGKCCAAPLASWRAAVLGEGAGSRKTSAEVRPLEQATAERIAGRECGPDESPAVCIATFGARSAKVGALIGKRARGASLEKWQAAR